LPAGMKNSFLEMAMMGNTNTDDNQQNEQYDDQREASTVETTHIYSSTFLNWNFPLRRSQIKRHAFAVPPYGFVIYYEEKV
jgi:hypothetical protein